MQLHEMKTIGFLRALLVSFGVILIILSWFAGDAVVYHGWAVIPSVIAPVLVVLLVWGMLFDMLMSAVFLSSGDGKSPAHYRMVLWVNALIIALILVSWLPFYWKVLT